MEKTNEILTIAGERVRVAYCKPGENCCARCCFSSGGGETCVGLDGGEEWPCEKFDLTTAYFVPAKEIANKPQTDANKNEPTREKKADFLQTNNADKAAEEAARAYGHKADKDGVGGDDYEDDIEIAFKAGIAWGRERMTKGAVSMDITDDTQWEDVDRFVHKNCDGGVKLIILK